MLQNFLLCLLGGNWDTKPAGRSYPSFPCSPSVILSERLWQLWHVMAAAAAAAFHPHGFLSLSHDFLFPVWLPASPTHRRPWPAGAGGVATVGETVKMNRKTLTGRMAGRPPSPSTLHLHPFLLLLTLAAHRESRTHFLFSLSLSLSVFLSHCSVSAACFRF